MSPFLRKFIPRFLIEFYHFALSPIGAFLYGFPSKKLIVIGVTGTNGKSTVVDLATRILEEAGHKVASLSSIKFKIREKEWPNTLKMTMPGRFLLQKFLKQAFDSGCKYAVLEVTSEGIKQHRHKFIDFDTVVFTNLAPEHIESHGGFEKYKIAKGKLFQTGSKTHIVNLDDKNAEYFLQFPAAKKIGFTAQVFSGAGLSVTRAEDVRLNPSGIQFLVDGRQFNLSLLGEFNVYNALAAICVGLSQGADLGICKRALEKVQGIPGRMEIVIREPFTVIVDYAHTPDAIAKVYQTARKMNGGKMICVLGSAGGGRDKWKRPEMGKIAARYCDEIILTNEDPYDEDPNQILSEIKTGILNASFPASNINEILDRREAIKKSLNLAKQGDIVIITGKGSEPWMCLPGGKKVSWDDRKITKEEFKKLR